MNTMIRRCVQTPDQPKAIAGKEKAMQDRLQSCKALIDVPPLVVALVGTAIVAGICAPIGKAALVAGVIAATPPLVCLALIALAGMIIGSALDSAWHSLNLPTIGARYHGSRAILVTGGDPVKVGRPGVGAGKHRRREVRLIRSAGLGV